MEDHFALCREKIYPILVIEVHEGWPEQRERRRFWFSPADAAEIVEEPSLKKALKGLSDR